jgi:hypothetical protein
MRRVPVAAEASSIAIVPGSDSTISATAISVLRSCARTDSDAVGAVPPASPLPASSFDVSPLPPPPPHDDTAMANVNAYSRLAIRFMTTSAATRR